MQEKSDVQLLRDYAGTGDEGAFRVLVTRHTDFVFSAALRQVNSPDLAGDLSQSVFTDLARKAQPLAAKMPGDGSLAGWLHRATRYAALSHLRDARRRLTNERQAMEQLLANSESVPDWERIRPVLDEALDSLGDEDREALLLRYFKNHDFRAIGLALGVSDDTAQKRVSRAVERLREFFAKSGVTVGAGGLVVVISANAVQTAPAGLAVTISSAAVLAGTTIAATVTATATKAIVMTTLQKSLITATIVAASVAVPLVVQHPAQVKLREENQSLRQRVDELTQQVAENEQRLPRPSLTPRLPAPQMQVAAVSAKPSAEDLQASNLLARLLQLRDRDGLLGFRQGVSPPKLTAAQIESYLKENGRSAASLLAAFRATDDQTLLQEAMQKYPDDAQVNFAAIFKKDSSPEERRRHLEALKMSAPGNALANYLSARDYLKSGQVDQAVLELNAAAGKSQFQDYSSDFVQNDEEAWRAAGYSVAEAKTVASMSLLLPQLEEMKRLSQDMVSLAKSYRQAGDEASAQAVLQAGVNLGQRFDAAPGEGLVSQCIGRAIQGLALNDMDPNSPYGTAGQTVKDRMDELALRRKEIKELVQQFDGAQQRMSDQDWISYKDRWRAFGEEAALRWMVSKYGHQ